MKKRVAIIFAISVISLLVIIACKTQKQLPSEIIIPSTPQTVEEQGTECITNEDCPQPRCLGMKGVCKKGMCEMQGECESYECQRDEDCRKGGCSGQICESKYLEPKITTCEFLPEYACYKQAKCGCIDSKCQFKQDIVLEQCLVRERK